MRFAPCHDPKRIAFICAAISGAPHLQGFWVAGKELLDKADAIEAQKVELTQKINRNQSALDRLARRLYVIDRNVCMLDGKCDGQTTAPAADSGAAIKDLRARQQAQRTVLEDDRADKEICAHCRNSFETTPTCPCRPASASSASA